jgi:predicted nucleotidyltransferase
MNTKRPKEINDYLNLVVERLKAADPYKIVLFGSYAKGEAKPDSDIDLMVILETKDGADESKRNRNVTKLVRNIHYKFGIDFIIYSKAEFERSKERGNFFIEAIERMGKTIYEKWD